MIRRSFSPVQIAGNIAGATIGGFAGSRLGSIRDAKGKAVYTVFTELGADQKAAILKALAVKVKLEFLALSRTYTDVLLCMKVFGMSGIADGFR